MQANRGHVSHGCRVASEHMVKSPISGFIFDRTSFLIKLRLENCVKSLSHISEHEHK